MKIKKSKHVKRWVNFYKMQYNFHQPYKIILDGNFLKICVDRQMKLKEYLSKWLKGQIWIQVTSCVLQELNNLGPDFRELFEEAKKLPKLKCGHIEGVQPNECIQELIGKTNEKQYWVCTQDTELRNKLKDIPAMPLFYFQQDIKLDIEEPAKNIMKEIEKEKMLKFLPTEQEQKQIKKVKKEEKAKLIEAEKKEFENEKRYLAAIIKPKAKAPNPLSVKKKQVKLNDSNYIRKTSNEDDQQNDENNNKENNNGEQKKRKRVRTRVRNKQQDKEQQKQQQMQQNNEN